MACRLTEASPLLVTPPERNRQAKRLTQGASRRRLACDPRRRGLLWGTECPFSVGPGASAGGGGDAVRSIRGHRPAAAVERGGRARTRSTHPPGLRPASPVGAPAVAERGWRTDAEHDGAGS